MAVLFIAEFEHIARMPNGPVQIAEMPAVAEQTVAIGGSSTQSSAFNAATNYIRVHTDAICSILIGSNPTATSSKTRMAADQTEYFKVKAGDKIAVITNT